MSNSPIFGFDQDYVIISTNVTIGRSFNSRGWALSRTDIHDWIPVEKFERNCKIIINGICSDAILRFNPRLFYESDKLSMYLKELHDKGRSTHKVLMKIKVHKNNLFENIPSIEKYTNLNYIDTYLTVGKSYKSKGWQLSRQVASLLFPSELYDEEYSICIDNIISLAKLNTQFRLFYKNDELSEYLEELHYMGAKDKIPAKIVFDYDSNNEKNIKLDKNDFDTERDNNEEVTCAICGNSYYLNDSGYMFDNSSDFCPECVRKIRALEAYRKINDFSLSKFVKKEFIENKFGADFNQIWELLLEYDFLIPFGDLFKLNSNEYLEKSYSEYLSNNSNENLHSKKRNRKKILDLIKESDDNELEDDAEYVCEVCGDILGENEVKKCSSCNDKSLATEYLHRIVTDIPYGKNFSKLNLLGLGISSLDANLIIDKLLEYNLIFVEHDIFYKFNNVTYLNEFIDRYADSHYELEINYLNDDSDVLKMSKEDLSSEEKIDELIKWKKYGDYISFKKGQYGFMTVQFKQNGAFLYSKGFGTSYEAKIESINYLMSLGLIIFVDNEEIKLKFR